MYFAAKKGHMEIVKLLIEEFKADLLTACQEQKFSPVDVAKISGFPELAKMLEERRERQLAVQSAAAANGGGEDKGKSKRKGQEEKDNEQQQQQQKPRARRSISMRTEKTKDEKDKSPVSGKSINMGSRKSRHLYHTEGREREREKGREH